MKTEAEIQIRIRELEMFINVPLDRNTLEAEGELLNTRLKAKADILKWVLGV